MNKALLVIDYSYDFVAADGKLTAGEPAMAIDQNIADKIDASVQDNDNVFFMMDLHFENDEYHPEYELFPPHNIEGTPGRELYGNVLKKYEEIKAQENVFFLDKTRYSAFSGTRLHHLLQERGVDTVVLTGVVTDICILHTAVDAYNLGYKIIVPESCVASFNADGHKVSLEHFKNTLGATVEP